MTRLEAIDGTNWEGFLAAPLVGADAGQERLRALRGVHRGAADVPGRRPTYGDVRFGKILLDRGGLAGFKRANPWLAEADVLPYTLIYRRGEKVAEFAGGGIGRLLARLERVRSESG